MDDDTIIIYKTRTGVSFKWKRCHAKHLNSINIIVKDVAIYLSNGELIRFSSQIDNALKTYTNCKNHINKSPCKVITLESPFPQITFIKSYDEALDLQNLIRGTLFELNLTKLLQNIL